MTNLEFCMVGSCCFVQYVDINKEEGHSDIVMDLWNNEVSDEAKSMAQWIEKAKLALYESGDSDSNENLSEVYPEAVKAQSEVFYDEGEVLFESFFEDEANEALLVQQARSGLSADVDYDEVKKYILGEFPKIADLITARVDKKIKKLQQAEKIRLVNRAMSSLVLFRGTKEKITAKLNGFRVEREESVNLEPFEEPLPENDFGFNTNLGKIGDKYLDFEIFMLPTNKKDTFLITEVSAF